MTGKTPVLILGTHLLAEEPLDLFADIDGIDVAGFVDNLDRCRCAERVDGLPVHWIGEHVFINRGATIGHHTAIRDFVSGQPGANIAGAVVTSDVPGHTMVAGLSARIVKADFVAR